MKKKQRKKIQVPASEKAASAPVAVPYGGPASPFLLLTALIILCSFAVFSFMRNKVYDTPVTLWADNSSKSVNKRRTHENYGQALSTAGLYKDALREFQTVLALKDDGSVPMRDLYREIGVVYFRINLIDDAISAWNTGLEHAPYDPSLLNNLSVAYLRQRRFDEAEKTIRNALAGAPYMPQALNSLGEVLMIKGNYEEALKYFLKAIEVSPEGASRYWNAALAFEKTGRIDKAYEYADRYLAMETNSGLKQRGVSYMNHLQGLLKKRP